MKGFALSLLLLLGIPTEVMALGAYQAPWPDMVDNTSLVFASTRAQMMQVDNTATAGFQSSLSKIYNVSPPWSTSGLRLGDANFYVTTAGGSAPETCTGNAITIDYQTIIYNGTAYPVTFGGAQSTPIADCGFSWSDPVAGLTLPAGSTYYVCTSASVNLNEFRPAVYRPQFTVAALTEAVEYTTTSQTAKRLTCSVSGVSSGVNVRTYGPAMIVAQGWDGTTPVPFIYGDSIAWSQNDNDYNTTTNGVVGYIERGLDDGSGSTRWGFYNGAIPGTMAGTQSSTQTGQYKLRIKMLRALPNKPFNRWFSEMGQNDLSVGNTFTLANYQAVMNDAWNFMHQNCSTCLMYQSTYPPRAAQASSSFWTDQINQVPTTGDTYPTGIRWQAYGYLTGGVGLPSFLTGVLNVTPAFQDSTFLDHWYTPLTSYTLGGNCNNAAASCSLAGSITPTRGDQYVVSPLAPSLVTRPLSQSQTGGGTPWTVTWVPGNNPTVNNTTGAVVKVANTTDGTHPTSSVHKAAAAILITAKNSGVLH